MRFKIEGLDLKSNTVVVEIRRDLLAPLANVLQAAPPSRHSEVHLTVRKLGQDLRDVCRVLYGEFDAEVFGFDVFDSESACQTSEEQPARETG